MLSEMVWLSKKRKKRKQVMSKRAHVGALCGVVALLTSVRLAVVAAFSLVVALAVVALVARVAVLLG